MRHMSQTKKVYDLNVYRGRERIKRNQAKIDFFRIIATSGMLTISLFISSGFLFMFPIEEINSKFIGYAFIALAFVNLYVLQRFWEKWNSARQMGFKREYVDFVKYTLVFFYPFSAVVILICIASYSMVLQVVGYLLIGVILLVSPLCYKVVKYSGIRKKEPIQFWNLRNNQLHKAKTK